MIQYFALRVLQSVHNFAAQDFVQSMVYLCTMGSTTEQLLTQATQYPDYIVISVFFALFVLYGFVRGTKAITELALALLVAAFVYKAIPYQFSWGEPAVFLVVVLLAIWVLTRETSGLDDSKNMLKVVMGAFGATGILLVISATVVDFSSLYTFGNPVAYILADISYRFYILVASLVAIALARKV